MILSHPLIEKPFGIMRYASSALQTDGLAEMSMLDPSWKPVTQPQLRSGVRWKYRNTSLLDHGTWLRQFQPALHPHACPAHAHCNGAANVSLRLDTAHTAQSQDGRGRGRGRDRGRGCLPAAEALDSPSAIEDITLRDCLSPISRPIFGMLLWFHGSA